LPGFARAWSDGQAAALVLGQGNFTSKTTASTQSGMSSPQGIAVDPTTGKVFVADTGNNRVLRFDNAAAKANGANADGVLGQPDYINSFQATSQSRMWQPWAVAVDSSGRLWVADYFNRRVLRFDNAASKPDGGNADGVLGQATFTTSNSATSQSGLRGPFGVAVDTTGRLWVNDGNNNRMLRFDNAAAKANGANADGVLGQANFTGSTSATTQSGFNSPFGLATDSAGNLWVPDSGNNRVLLFEEPTQVAIAPAGSSPSSDASVDFNVTFSSPITGLSASNFTLTTSGVRDTSITSVSGSGTAWTVTASSGFGSGTLRLDMTSTAGVQDANGNGLTNVPYTSGESYTITRIYTLVALPFVRQ
jgi:DNA-binding beta-propeller fold protein YncE